MKNRSGRLLKRVSFIGPFKKSGEKFLIAKYPPGFKYQIKRFKTSFGDYFAHAKAGFNCEVPDQTHQGNPQAAASRP